MVIDDLVTARRRLNVVDDDVVVTDEAGLIDVYIVVSAWHYESLEAGAHAWVKHKLLPRVLSTLVQQGPYLPVLRETGGSLLVLRGYLLHFQIAKRLVHLLARVELINILLEFPLFT